MLCVCVAQGSQKLARVDMHNARGRADMVELRLDHFRKTPELAALLEQPRLPLIVSCRSRDEGGEWEGTEEERLQILRQAVASGADYVELDLETARAIGRYGKTKRVISARYRGPMDGSPLSLAQKCLGADPDVIRIELVCESVSDLHAALSLLLRSEKPTVVAAAGAQARPLAVLAGRLGSPWVYAALETGMEAWTGQPTVAEMAETLGVPRVGKQTRLVGVVTDPTCDANVGPLNRALARSGADIVALPFIAESGEEVEKLVATLKPIALLFGGQFAASGFRMAEKLEEPARDAQLVDLLVRTESGWMGYHTLWRAAFKEIERALKTRSPGERPLEGRIVVVAGAGAKTQSMAYGVGRCGGIAVVAGRNAEDAKVLAQRLNCRYIGLEATYTTMHDCVIWCGEEGERPAVLEPNYLRASHTVLDLARFPTVGVFQEGAQLRGALVVEPHRVLRNQLEIQLSAITGKRLDSDAWSEIVPEPEAI